MNIRYLLASAQPIRRNRQWLGAPIPLAMKIAYYAHIVASYLRLATGVRRIRYLGGAFAFDNPATPLNLQAYPYEVGVRLLSRLRQPPRVVLDVGANIGQFSRTLAFLAPQATIDSVEPNPEIFEVLRHNYTDAALYATIREVLGDFEVLYSSGFDSRSETYDLLLSFPGYVHS